MYMPRTNSFPSRSDIKILATALDIPMGSPDTSVHYDPVSAAIAVGGSLIGSSMAGKSAERAANTSANASLEAADRAASASAFRPVGMTTRYGTSNFQMGTDQYGNPIVTEASYTASPEIRALQDRLSSLYGTSLGQAETAFGEVDPMRAATARLFNLGNQYLAESPEQARQRIFNELQDIRRPEQIREEERLASGVFGRGRTGLNIGPVGQPELYSLARAREAQRATDAYNAEQQAQQRTQFGTGLFGSGGALLGDVYGLQTKALAPFQTQFGVQSLLEQQALQPLELGVNIGGRNINTAGASSILQGGINASQTQLQGNLVRPTLMAQNISTAGQNYMQNQQQQNLFNFLTQQQQNSIYGQAGYSPWGSGFSNPYAAGAGVGFTAANVYG